MLLGFALLTVIGLVTVIPVLRDWLQQRGIRRRGAAVQGRVVDNDFRDFYSLRGTRPIARYRVVEHEYQVSVGNCLGRLPIGSAIDLLVDLDAPYRSMAARGHSTTMTLLVRAVFTSVGVAGLAATLALR